MSLEKIFSCDLAVILFGPLPDFSLTFLICDLIKIVLFRTTMFNPPSLFDRALREIVERIYSYDLLDKMKGTLPVIIVEECKKRYFAIKEEASTRRTVMLRKFLPSSLWSIDDHCAYGIRYNGVCYVEEAVLDGVHVSTQTRFCRPCWTTVHENFKDKTLDGVTMRVVMDDPKEEIYSDGVDFHFRPTEYVCDKCYSAVFFQTWESEVRVNCDCEWCQWGDPCPYDSMGVLINYPPPTDSDSYSDYDSDTDSGYETI